jgi:UDP-glucose 4-epimerase
LPNLSATGVSSEDEPRWAREINVGGTRNLLNVLRAQARPPRILFASSLHVYGRTQDQSPYRSVDDPLSPTDHYSRHKIICERLVRCSRLRWAIFRLGASMPTRLILDRAMFEVPLNTRIEFVHQRDVALAMANALDIEAVWGRIWNIGGGPRCQITEREMVRQILETVGVGMLPDGVFAGRPFPVDWLDTHESQSVLRFQYHTLQDYVQDVANKLGFRRHLVRLCRPLIRAWLLHQAQAMQA